MSIIIIIAIIVMALLGFCACVNSIGSDLDNEELKEERTPCTIDDYAYKK